MHSMMRDGESNAPVQKGAREIAITGTSFAFAPKVIRLTAKERATLVLTSNDAEHDVTVEGAPGVGHVVHASADTTERGGLEISKPGTYVFYCSVSGHRKAGMVGRIVVSP